LVGCVVESLLTPEPIFLPQNTKVEMCCCLFLGVLSESVLSDIAASLLEGFLGITAVSDAGLAALKACELMSRHMVACLGAMA